MDRATTEKGFKEPIFTRREYSQLSMVQDEDITKKMRINVPKSTTR